MRSRMQVLALCLFLASCSLFIPDRTAPKSSSYDIKAPREPWRKVRASEDSNSSENLHADIAFENPETGAMMSLNSLCRKYTEDSLEELSQSLVRGIEEREVVKQSSYKLAGADAMDVLYQGVVDKVRLNIRTVVLVKDHCTYDFVYVAIPAREKNSAQAFEDFLHSFRVD